MSVSTDDLKKAIKIYLPLDDGMTQANEEFKRIKKPYKQSRDRIIEYFKQTGLDQRIKVRSGTQYLTCEVHEKKANANPARQKEILRSLIERGVNDYEQIWTEMHSQGTKQIYTLKRVDV